MNSCLITHGTSLTGIVDITANNISLFQDNGPPKNIEDMFIHTSDISIAEPYDIQIYKNCNVIQMYQFLGYINDTNVAGLESILNYINDNIFSKADPAVNEHCYNTTDKHYIMTIYIIHIYIYIVSIKVTSITLINIDIHMNIIIINKHNS